MQNNRYGNKFEGEKSALSGSYGGGLLESSRLVTEEYVSPSQSRTFRDLSKYLSKSGKTTPHKNVDLIHEQQEYVDTNLPPPRPINDSITPEMDFTEKNRLRTQAQERYSASRLQEPEELIQYNHTFSTFGPNEEAMVNPSDTKEDRIRPARFHSHGDTRNVYERLYQPKRKDKVRTE